MVLEHPLTRAAQRVVKAREQLHQAGRDLDEAHRNYREALDALKRVLGHGEGPAPVTLDSLAAGQA